MKYIPIIIPCAGKGTRSGLNSPKTLFVYDGKTILESIVGKCIVACDKIGLVPRFYIIIRDFSCDFIEVLSSFSSKIEFTLVIQPTSDGTADAVYRGLTKINEELNGSFLCALIWGDCIGFSSETLTSAIEATNQYPVVVPGFYTDDCYTVFNLDQQNMITACNETRNSKNKITGYTDIGIFSFNPEVLMPFVENEVASASEDKCESSFINVLSEISRQNDCLFLDSATPLEKQGFNSPSDLKL
ncbi:MAG: bifunctional N-acetylglucosamine-1-phosphate-uridyltransferase [Psychroserpens sp.]|jgi:bifunctional N-acetylglucosamine-1-phosphate-uridyltransferase/glucosamine-1-phosphate-acetyltransferase GlmU-like protein